MGKQWATVCLKDKRGDACDGDNESLLLTFARAEAKPAPVTKRKSAMKRLLSGIKNTFSPKVGRKSPQAARKASKKPANEDKKSPESGAIGMKKGKGRGKAGIVVNADVDVEDTDHIDLAAAKQMAREALAELTATADEAGGAAAGTGGGGGGDAADDHTANQPRYNLIGDAEPPDDEYEDDEADLEALEKGADVAAHGRAAEYETPIMASKVAEYVVKIDPVDNEYGVQFGEGPDGIIIVKTVAENLKSPFPPQIGDQVLAVESIKVFSLNAANEMLPCVGPKRTKRLSITVARRFPIHPDTATTVAHAAVTRTPDSSVASASASAQTQEPEREPEPGIEPGPGTPPQPTPAGREPEFEEPTMASKRAEFTIKVEATGKNSVGMATFGLFFKEGSNGTVQVSALGRVQSSYPPEKDDEVIAIGGNTVGSVADAMELLAAASDAPPVSITLAREFSRPKLSNFSFSQTTLPLSNSTTAAPPRVYAQDVLKEIASSSSLDGMVGDSGDGSKGDAERGLVDPEPASATAGNVGSAEYLVTYPAADVNVYEAAQSFPCFVSGIAKQSQHGTRHGNLNQDGAFYRKLPTPAGDVVVAVVFDGHGILGEVSADVAVRQMETILDDEDEVGMLVSNPEAWIVATFDALQESVEEAHRSPPQHYTYPGKPGSEPLEFELETVGGRFGIAYRCTTMELPPAPIDFGCTAAMAVVIGDTLTTGCIGDAGCVLCYTDPELDENTGKVLSVAHTASEPTEIERINRDFEGKAILTHDGYLAPVDDDLAQYEVQLTRSLGHSLLKEFGITCTPDVRQQTLSSDKAFALLLCSDGVTDELQPRDIAERIHGASTASEACITLCQDAQDFCMDRDKVDDCTAIVISFRLSRLLISSESC